MFTKILGILAIIMGLFCIFVAFQPSEFQITRSAKIEAPLPTVFDQINNLHQWQAWSPWENMDPALKRNYEGESAGTGAIYSWTGNNQVGEGRMTITESRPNEFIRIKLEFFKPFRATNITEFTVKPEGNQTVVTWTMSGHNNFVSKAMSLIMNCKKMVGGQFEKGLANLKVLTEEKSL